MKKIKKGKIKFAAKADLCLQKGMIIKMEEPILKCEKLNKTFGKKHILKDVSFEIQKGDILGFIGPNGARKNNYN